MSSENPSPALLSDRAVSRAESAKGLTARAYRNAFASILQYAAKLMVDFVITPLLVGGLGPFGYGVWQVLGRLGGYVSAATGRPAQALKWVIANKQGSADYAEKRRYVGSTLVTWALFSPVGGVLGAVIAWYAPYWLGAPEDLIGSVRIAAALLVINLLAAGLVDVPQLVLSGENLAYKRMGLSVALVFAGGGFTAIAIHLNTGIAGVAAAMLATTLLGGVAFLHVVRACVPWFAAAMPSASEVRSFLCLGGWFLAWLAVAKLMRVSDVIVLGIFDSPEQVTAFAVTRFVPEALGNVISMIVFGVTPGLGGIIGAGDLQKAAHVRSEIMAMAWLALTAAGSTILIWNLSFLQLWIGGEHYAGAVANLLVVVMVAQFVLLRSDADIINTTLNLRQKTLFGLLSAAVSLALAIVLVGVFRLGVTGLCAGFITGRAILSLGYPWLVARFLGTSQVCGEGLGLVRVGLVTLLLFGFGMYMGDLVAVHSWAGLVLGAFTTLVLASLIALFGGLTRERRNQVFRRMRHAIPMRTHGG